METPVFPPLSDGTRILSPGPHVMRQVVWRRTEGLTTDDDGNGIVFAGDAVNFAEVHFVCSCSRSGLFGMPPLMVSFDLEAIAPDTGSNSLFVSVSPKAVDEGGHENRQVLVIVYSH